MDRDAWQRDLRASQQAMQKSWDSLSVRERQVLQLVVSGMLTKQIAQRLEISIKTVEAHRSNLTRKMGYQSVIQLVHAVTRHQTPVDQCRTAS